MRHSAFCVRLERLVRLSPLLVAVLGVAGMLQTHDGVLDSLLYAWLHVTCVAHFEQGCVVSGRCVGVSNQTVSMRAGSSLGRSYCSS